MVCTLIQMYHVLGKKWSLLLLEELFYAKAVGFGVLAKKLKITPKILAARLRQLGSYGIVQQDSVSLLYALTEKGKELVVVLKELKKWAVKHSFTPLECPETNCATCSYQP